MLWQPDSCLHPLDSSGGVREKTRCGLGSGGASGSRFIRIEGSGSEAWLQMGGDVCLGVCGGQGGRVGVRVDRFAMCTACTMTY